jgi:uncharacterized membrane protein YidH (DUF202 family)
VLRSGLRRLLIVFVVIFALTSVVSLVLGALAHANLERALADGFYVAGAAVLVGSFVLGLRGPLRSDWGEGEEAEVPTATRGFGALMPRAIRRTTSDERNDARRTSLALFALGVALILIGAGFDPSRSAV